MNNVNVNTKDSYGDTLLHNAESLDEVKELIKAGADVNARDWWGRTPIHTAKTVEIIHALIKAGADIRAKDYTGRTVFGIIKTEEVEKTKKDIKHFRKQQWCVSFFTFLMQFVFAVFFKLAELPFGFTHWLCSVTISAITVLCILLVIFYKVKIGDCLKQSKTEYARMNWLEGLKLGFIIFCVSSSLVLLLCIS
jgi:magnesium-transporting ATPase (P-type)